MQDLDHEPVCAEGGERPTQTEGKAELQGRGTRHNNPTGEGETMQKGETLICSV